MFIAKPGLTSEPVTSLPSDPTYLLPDWQETTSRMVLKAWHWASWLTWVSDTAKGDVLDPVSTYESGKLTDR